MMCVQVYVFSLEHKHVGAIAVHFSGDLGRLCITAAHINYFSRDKWRMQPSRQALAGCVARFDFVG